jgi:hypothetical protein
MNICNIKSILEQDFAPKDTSVFNTKELLPPKED